MKPWYFLFITTLLAIVLLGMSIYLAEKNSNLDQQLKKEHLKVTEAKERTQTAIDNWSELLKECEHKVQVCEDTNKEISSTIALLPKKDGFLVMKIVEAKTYKNLLDECLRIHDESLDREKESLDRMKKILGD